MHDPTASPEPRLRVNLVMHLMTPYRAPVIRALADRFDVEVQVMERPSQFGTLQSSNRSDDWRPEYFTDLTMRGLTTVRLSWRGVALFVLLSSRGARAMRRTDAVILNGWEAPLYWQTILKAKLLRKPTINLYESPGATHRYHSGPVALLRRTILRTMDAVISPGPAATESLVRLGVERERINEGFNAVDVAFFSDATEAARAQAGHGSWRGDRIVFVGQLIDRKRVDALLEAFATLPERCELVLIGDGERRLELEAHCERLGIRARVRFVGQVMNRELPRFFASASTLCLVSAEEVWGLVVNEALAAGLRVVVSANCGVVPSIRRMHGVRVVREDLSDLAQALQEQIGAATSPIANPEILRHGPTEFAEVFASAINAAARRRHKLPTTRRATADI